MAFEKIHPVLPDFIKALNALSLEYYKKNLPNIVKWAPVHTLEPGKKYIRVVQGKQNDPLSRSVYCFLDGEGNIYKADGWKKPAKHIRGNILTDANFSIGKALNPYGAAYLR